MKRLLLVVMFYGLVLAGCGDRWKPGQDQSSNTTTTTDPVSNTPVKTLTSFTDVGTFQNFSTVAYSSTLFKTITSKAHFVTFGRFSSVAVGTAVTLETVTDVDTDLVIGQILKAASTSGEMKTLLVQSIE